MFILKYFIMFSLFLLTFGFMGCSEENNSATPSTTTPNTEARAQLGNLANAQVHIYKIEDNGSLSLQWNETTSSGNTLDNIGKFNSHINELELNRFYIYEVVGGEDWDFDDDGILDENYTLNNGKIRAVANQNDIKYVGSNLKVTLASEILYELVERNITHDFNATTFESLLDTTAQSIVYDIDNNGKINVRDVLVYTVPSYKPMLNTTYNTQLDTLLTNIHQGTTALPNLVITSEENLTVLENMTSITTLQARDLEGDSLTWSIVGGDDKDMFSLNSSTGELSFLSAHDYEHPTDSDTNNTYMVDINVTDGTHYHTQNFTIYVLNINDITPTIVTADQSISEAHTKVTALQGIDLDGDSLSWSLTGGDDKDLFTINNNILEFITAPNYNQPLDSDTNNIYVVQITLTDGEHNVSKTFHITVTDILLESFIITVQTDNNGTSSDTQFIVPTKFGEIYNYNIDCDNDGVDEATAVDGNYTCNYTSAGEYKVVIKDNSGKYTGFPRIYFNNEGDKEKITGINQWGAGQWSSMQGAFYGCKNLNNAGGAATDSPNLSTATSMYYMFTDASSFNQDISHWDTSTITTMRGMFYGALAFNQDIGQWDVSNVTDISSMFKSTASFNQDISDWNTSNVTDMSSMFYGALAFNQDISKWDTSQVTNMSLMFKNTALFNQDISNWNTSNVTDMNDMFYGAAVFNQDIGQWDTHNVTDMSGMFKSAPLFNQDINDWNTTNVTDMSSMFYSATNFNQPLDKWNTSSVTHMGSMFKYATHFNQYIGTWNTGNVRNMSGMFYWAEAFNRGIGNWNTTHVTDMNAMFKDAHHFNQDIGNWDTAKVTTMKYMFYNAAAFNQNLAQWDISNVTDISYMFKNAIRFNGTLNNWDTSKVTKFSSMFYNAKAFNQDISSWDTSNVENMTSMFKDATAFNQDIGNWITSKVTNMNSMFYNAAAFNQDIGNWDTGKVTDMALMFKDATVFNQYIKYWNTENVTTMNSMFYNAKAFDQDITLWNTSNVTDMYRMFYGASAFSGHDLSGWNVSKVTDHTDFFLNAGDNNIEPLWP